MSDVEFSSDAVRAVKFREKLKGYHAEEVDAFLERCADAFDRMTAGLAEATARAIKAEAALAAPSEADDSVRRTLVLAQRTAEMAIREANEEANRLRAGARLDAERVHTAARTEAADLVGDARRRAAEMERETERTRAAAIEHATATVDEADATAQATVAHANQQAAALHATADTEIAARRAAVESELAEWSAEARQTVEAAVRSLEGQRDQLWADVANLSDYLATERARVLDVLATAVEGFGASLAPAPLPLAPPAAPAPPATPAAEPQAVEPEPHATAEPEPQPAAELEPQPAAEPEPQPAAELEVEPPEGETEAPSDEPVLDEPLMEDPVEAPLVEAPSVEAPSVDEPAEIAASAEADEPSLTVESALSVAPAHVDPAEIDAEAVSDSDDADESPASLLFSLKDDRGRTDIDRYDTTPDTKPRKTLLGRRRS